MSVRSLFSTFDSNLGSGDVPAGDLVGQWGAAVGRGGGATVPRGTISEEQAALGSRPRFEACGHSGPFQLLWGRGGTTGEGL